MSSEIPSFIIDFSFRRNTETQKPLYNTVHYHMILEYNKV